MNDYQGFVALNENPKLLNKELRVWFDGKFKDTVRKIINKFRFDQSLAEDVALKAMLKATESIKSLDNEVALPSWFKKIIFHLCVDETKRLDINAKDKTINLKEVEIISVTQKNGVKITEYASIKTEEVRGNKFKFISIYDRSDEPGYEDKSWFDRLDMFGSDSDGPEEALMMSEKRDCLIEALFKLDKIDSKKALAIEMQILGASKEEIASKLNKSSKAIREYLSQCFKKYMLIAQPCFDL